MGYISIYLHTGECLLNAILSIDFMCMMYFLHGIFGIHTSVKYRNGYGALDILVFISCLVLLQCCSCDSTL